MLDYLHRLWLLTLSFGQVGLFAFGGGNSMIKLIEQEAVTHRHWLTQEEYDALVGGTFLFPGLTAEKISGMVGLRVAGIGGLIVAALGISLPGITLTVFLFTWLLANRNVAWIKKLFDAMQWGAIALIAGAAFDMMRPHFNANVSWTAVVLALALFCSIEFLSVNAFLALVAFVGLYMVLPA